MYYIARDVGSQELYHFGIKGQKWGVRRFQNDDGTLTQAGRQRYYYGEYSLPGSKRKYKMHSPGEYQAQVDIQQYSEKHNIKLSKQQKSKLKTALTWNAKYNKYAQLDSIIGSTTTSAGTYAGTVAAIIGGKI